MARAKLWMVTSTGYYPKTQSGPAYIGYAVARELRMRGFDVVCVDLATGPKIAKLNVLFNTLLSLLVTARPGAIVFNSPPVRSLAPVIVAARLRGVPAILITHGGLFVERSELLSKPVNRWLLRQVECFVCVSKALASIVRQWFPCADIRVIHNAVDADPAGDFTTRMEGQRAKRRPTVGFLGRLERSKGVFVLLRAFEFLVQRKLTDGTLVFAGSGSAENELKQMVQTAGLGGVVRFAGFVTGARKREFFSECTCIVVPSVYWEPFGMVVLEAMSAGVPVVASAVGGVPEILVDGESGFLVPPGDHVALARKLFEVIRLSERDRARIVANARFRVHTYFSWKRAGDQYADLVRELVGSRALPP